MPEIVKMLELSTAHAPSAAELERHVDPFATSVGEYGSLLAVRDKAQEDDETPAWLAAILDHAREHYCRFILFDADAPLDPALESWEW